MRAQKLDGSTGYDVRLLIDTLPSSTEGETLQSNDARLSPTGWSDLPSDTEDTFFFSPEEVEDYHREKRRRMIDQSREERLRALRGEAGDDEDENFDDDPWGGSDEEPDEAQKDFMRRTATHILNSPNPAQLEMRILANHGADKRFAFLRGRWSRTWKITMGRTRIQLEAKKNKNTEERKAGLGGLAGYGDSDASEDERVDDADENKETGKVLDLQETDDAKMQLPNPQFPSEEALKEARRAKAREWAAKRRASNQSGAQ
ncbi:hypothetical protein BDY19DRAFT_970782 [Irpex rosettiformis]|uniref:Uncharacterized protein n=1 Tax=Irpex rosettiformis TaxID=378272 RepID=A0ACB8TR33_9APHY|nr:hypothetical protein BDY19DRAFT_970782 [Irpex rosettiformis]